jgi:hypothetical protein
VGIRVSLAEFVAQPSVTRLQSAPELIEWRSATTPMSSAHAV